MVERRRGNPIRIAAEPAEGTAQEEGSEEDWGMERLWVTAKPELASALIFGPQGRGQSIGKSSARVNCNIWGYLRLVLGCR